MHFSKVEHQKTIGPMRCYSNADLQKGAEQDNSEALTTYMTRKKYILKSLARAKLEKDSTISQWWLELTMSGIHLARRET